MKIRREYILLFLIFVFTLSVRLYYTFQTPYYDIGGYYVIREVEHIQKSVTPMFRDDLSYGGRTLVFPPYYYYILFFFKTLLGEFFTFKMLPNIFASLLVFVVYAISYNLTEDYKASLFTSLISGFIPVFFSETLNTISAYSLIVPLTFLTLYFFLKINKKKKIVVYFITALTLLRLSHPSAIFLVLALLIYILIVKLEALKHSREELEIILFSAFVMIWSFFIVYKQPLLVHGPYVVWQNIPKQILSQYFTKFNVLEAIYNIGVIPFICGVYIIYNFMFRKKDKKIYLFISFALLMFILLWLKLVQIKTGLIFLSVVLTLLFAKFFNMFFAYLEKTKVHKFKIIIYLLLFFIILGTSFFPSVIAAKEKINASLKDYEFKALEWIKNFTEENSVILAPVQEGYLITSIAKRKNIADSSFLLIEDADQRVRDIENMYVTVFETEAINLLNKYGVDYIYFSERAKKEFNIETIKYINPKCFQLVYFDKIEIYKSLCVMEES